ncbi:MAG: hypothetical protein WD532_00285 [Acidimicrobiia bacterium]
MIQEFLQLPTVTLIRVLFGMVLAFGILPIFVLPRPRSATTSLDAAVVRSVRWFGVILVISHLLAIVRLFHVVPILLLCIWGAMLKQGRISGGRIGRAITFATGEATSPTTKAVATDDELDASDDELDELHEGSYKPSPLQLIWLMFSDVMHLFERLGPRVMLGWLATIGTKLRRLPARIFNRRTWMIFALLTPILGILGTSLALRVDLAFRYETLSPPEAYVFLTWAKSFAGNELFVDGIYPHGLPVTVAFIGKLTPGIDLYEIIRYTGPLIGMLLVFGIFYLCLRLTANAGAALFAAGAFGLLGTLAEWHAPWTRQTGPLPQELGFAIALLALPSAVLAVTDREPGHLRTVTLAAVGIGLIHPVPLVVFLVMATAGAAGAALVSGAGGRVVFQVVSGGALGGLLAHAYVPIGLLLGVPMFRGMDQPFTSVANLGGSRTQQLLDFFGGPTVGHTPLSIAAGIGATLALVAAWILHRRPRTRHIGAQLAGLALIGLVAVSLYDVRWVTLPVNILGPVATVAGIGLAAALGAGLAAVTAGAFAISRPLRRSAVVIVAAALGITAIGLSFEPGPRTRAPSEYDTMAAVTRDIMRSQDAFTFSIVGTPQQRQAVTGVGSFIELWVFARDVTVRDAQDPGFVVPDLSSLMFARDLGQNLPIPTADIYIFVEKEPFPVPEQPPLGPTEEYYYDREKRGRIMATVFGWAEFYRYYHTDMSVYYEDDEIIVYRIQRRPNTVAAAASPQFKDYTWEPGILFTGGPAEPSEVVIPWES